MISYLLWKKILRDKNRFIFLIIFALMGISSWSQLFVQFPSISSVFFDVIDLVSLSLVFYALAFFTAFFGSFTEPNSVSFLGQLNKYPISSRALVQASASAIFKLYLLFVAIYLPSYLVMILYTVSSSWWHTVWLVLLFVAMLYNGVVVGLFCYLGLAMIRTPSLKLGLLGMGFALLLMLIASSFFTLDLTFSPPKIRVDVSALGEHLNLDLAVIGGLLIGFAPILLARSSLWLDQGQYVMVALGTLVLLIESWIFVTLATNFVRHLAFFHNAPASRIRAAGTTGTKFSNALNTLSAKGILRAKENVLLVRSPNLIVSVFLNLMSGVIAAGVLVITVGLENVFSNALVGVMLGLGLGQSGLNVWGNESSGLQKLLLSPLPRHGWLWSKHLPIFKSYLAVFAILAATMAFFLNALTWQYVLGLAFIWLSSGMLFLCLSARISIAFPLIVETKSVIMNSQISLIGVILYLLGSSVIVALNMLLLFLLHLLLGWHLVWVGTVAVTLSTLVYLYTLRSNLRWLNAKEEHLFMALSNRDRA